MQKRVLSFSRFTLGPADCTFWMNLFRVCSTFSSAGVQRILLHCTGDISSTTAAIRHYYRIVCTRAVLWNFSYCMCNELMKNENDAGRIPDPFDFFGGVWSRAYLLYATNN